MTQDQNFQPQDQPQDQAQQDAPVATKPRKRKKHHGLRFLFLLIIIVVAAYFGGSQYYSKSRQVDVLADNLSSGDINKMSFAAVLAITSGSPA